jgi:hypothetical protein
MLCRNRDLQAISAEKRQFGGTMDVEINNVIYMELHLGPKMAHVNTEKQTLRGRQIEIALYNALTDKWTIMSYTVHKLFI